jgi:hypothetical protein
VAEFWIPTGVRGSAFGVGAAQHGLMPQYEQLDVLGGGRATQQQEQPSTCWKIKYNSRKDTAEIMPSHW